VSSFAGFLGTLTGKVPIYKSTAKTLAEGEGRDGI
jgi:hypothetical protein